MLFAISSHTPTATVDRLPSSLVRNLSLLISTAALVALMLLTSGLGTERAAYAQVAQLPFADTTEAASFGNSVAIDGNRAAVGSSGEHICGQNSGAVYIFERPDGGAVTSWEKTARITPSDCREGAFFGRDLDLSGDHLLVSSTVEFFAQEEPHVAYMYEIDEEGSWRETSHLTARSDLSRGSFATSVTLEETRALITAQGRPGGGSDQHGMAYIFEKDEASGTWQLAHSFHGMHRGNHSFGAMGSLRGNVVAIAAPAIGRQAGGVHIFERNETRWTETDYLDGFRDEYLTVALGDGQLAVGEGVAGSRGEGRVYIYQREDDGRWKNMQTLRPDLPYEQGAFGMELSMHGSTLLITGYDEQLGFEFNIDRVVYVFEHDPAQQSWQQRHIIDIGQVDFGTDIDLDDRLAIVGHVATSSPGRAYVVQLY